MNILEHRTPISVDTKALVLFALSGLVHGSPCKPRLPPTRYPATWTFVDETWNNKRINYAITPSEHPLLHNFRVPRRVGGKIAEKRRENCASR